MKKFIALISVSLTFGFALALANTEDSALNRDSTSETSTEANQQGGSAGVSSDSNSQNTGSNMQGDTSPISPNSKMSESKMSRSCTDEKGVMLRPGQKGFKECLQTEKGKHSEQMGGTSEGQSDTTYKSKEEVYKTQPSPNPTNPNGS